MLINLGEHNYMKNFCPKIILPVVLILFFLFSLLSCSNSKEQANFEISVMLEENENVQILSDNPVTVKGGESAVFDVKVADGYKIVNLDENISYSDGKVIADNLIYPCTISYDTREFGEYWFEYNGSTPYGKVSSSLTAGIYPEDTEVTITVTPNEGSFFMGFSIDKPINEGGQIVENGTEYTFTLDKNYTIYPNFISENTKILNYHSAGGEIANSDSETFLEYIDDSLYILPNSQICDGTFSKEGYALLGYNTKEDGTGRYYGTGWNVVMPENGNQIELWCQWVEYSNISDFEYIEKNNTVTITKYNGNDDFVVIPEFINDKKVTAISSGAFDNSSLSSAYITRNIETIEKNAFNDCKNLTTLYICDSVTDMLDVSFSGCDNLKTLNINATIYPSMSYTLMGTCAIKFERLMTAQDKKVMLVSGSSSLYGMDSELFEELIDYRYSMVNYGCHANTPSTFFIELCSAFTNEGDILIVAPEMFDEQMGSINFNNIVWQIFEGALDAMSYVDIRNYNGVLTTFAAFNKSRTHLQEQSYEFGYNDFTKYGDYGAVRPTQSSESYVTFANGVLDFSRSLFKPQQIENLNKAFKMITDKGGTVYWSFAPCNINALNQMSQKESRQNTYMELIEENFDATIISVIKDYVLSGQYFYDTDYHCGNEGAQIRTRLLARDLLAQLDKESK